MKHCLGYALTGVSILFAASAQAYPDRPITVVAQQPPGSGSDAMTRVWSDCVSHELGQTLIVQNKPGANGILAVNYLKGAAADGYTVMTIGMSQMTITPYVYKQPPYDPAADFRDIAMFGESALVLATSGDGQIKNLDDLARVARTTPGGINFGSPGKGSPAHLLTAALAQKLDVPATHIPFIGESAGVTALIGKQIQVMTLVISTALPQIKSGKLTALAVFANQREAGLPDVKLISEQINAPDLARPAWISVVGKAGFPEAAAKRLSEASQACERNPQFRAKMESMGVRPVYADGAAVRTRAAADTAVWKPLIQQLDLVQD